MVSPQKFEEPWSIWIRQTVTHASTRVALLGTAGWTVCFLRMNCTAGMDLRNRVFSLHLIGFLLRATKKFYFTSPQPITPKETSDSDFTIEDVMLWPGMRFLRSQCKRCSTGRLHNSLPSLRESFEPFVLKETKPTYRRSYATCTSWLRTNILHRDVPRFSTIFILLGLNPLGQRKLPIVFTPSVMLCLWLPLSM